MARTRSSPVDEEEEDLEEVVTEAEEDSGRGVPTTNIAFDRKVVLAKGDISGSKLYLLRHPKSNKGVMFRVDKDNLDEVLLVDDPFRSLLLDESVVSDGRVRVFSPYHPIFIVLPYLNKKKSRFEVLDEILSDEEWPAVALLKENQKMMETIEEVVDRKDVCGEVVYRINEEKTLSWLSGRFSRLRDALVANSKLHSSICSSPEVLDRYSFGVLCDYLSPDMVPILKEHLHIVDAPAVREEEDRKRPVDEDENFYGREQPPAKKTPSVSATQKRLQQASKGTKALTSFFTKNNK